jgi:hypothetical protein
MSTIIGGSSPSITFSDSTTQASAGLPLTGGTLSGALTVPTLNAPSGVLATQNGMTGIAKAWVNFQGGNGNTAGVIIGSFNVSSITVNGTGYYTVNFATSMTNTTYAVVSTTGGAGSRGDIVNAFCDNNGTGVSPTTSSFAITVFNSTAANPTYLSVAVLGS